MNTRLKRLRKKILALVVSAAMLLLLVPGFSDDIQADGGITVSFRLIGCTKSTGKIELIGRGKKEATGYLGAEYVTWIPTKSYSLDMGSTVYDLFTKALSEAGISSTGAEGNYVKSITAPAACGGYTLAEFTNGQYSGWMYTVNGSHSDVGLQMCPLNDGDQVIFHYVNDYACESADWQGGASGSKGVLECLAERAGYSAVRSGTDRAANRKADGEANGSANRKADGEANGSTNRKTDRKTDREANGSANRKTDGKTNGSANRKTDGKTNGSANRSANRKANREANGSANRKTDREANGSANRKTDRKTNGSADRKTDRAAGNSAAGRQA